MKIDFYFDPVCPWCWITARWLVEVREHRSVEVTWRSFSLAVKNRDREVPAGYREQHQAGLRALRVVEAVRAKCGDGAVENLYTELGRRIHHDEERPLDLAGALAAVGLDGSLLAAADEERWTPVIEASMDAALEVVGDDAGVPIVVFEGAGGYFGPIMSPAPTGAAAAEVFDQLVALAGIPGFYELKRTRTVGPEFGSRP